MVLNNLSTEHQIKRALDACGSEPVHIPGTVQPFACLIACDGDLGEIVFASENCEEFLGFSPDTVLGKDVGEVLEEQVCHSIRNAISGPGLDTERVSVGTNQIEDIDFEIGCFRSGRYLVLEIEMSQDASFDGNDALKTLGFLFSKLQTCGTQQSLFDVTVDLIHHVSGFDRAMIYRFDLDFNGEVIAEKKRASMDPFLGLRFPNWDIPPQARDIMKKIPLRLICDVDQTPRRLQTVNPDVGSLDLTLAASRGVSEVHLEYLRNMGVRSTVTLNVCVDEKLWGIISLHHQQPKVLAPKLRELLESFVHAFSTRVMNLRQKETLERIQSLDVTIAGSAIPDTDPAAALVEIAPSILTGINAHGIASISGEKVSTFGEVPDIPKVRALEVWSRSHQDDVVTTTSICKTLRDHGADFGKCAGALVAKISDSEAVCIFRNEASGEIAWAGNPEKKIEEMNGSLRLSPRGSFSTYLEKVDGSCFAWSEEDIHFARHVRTLLHVTEQVLLNKMSRQQSLMIDELNHRVRNVLTLVGSISKQARRRCGSLDSYATAVESRIRALAASHELSAGSFVDPVSLHELIVREFEPYGAVEENRVIIHGQDRKIRADAAPIFSLVIHELATNAVKYGALSVDTGEISINLSSTVDGTVVHWKESGGRDVSSPRDNGFGVSMIEQAVPHQFGGTALLTFNRDGVCAEFLIPHGQFDDESLIAADNAKSNLVSQEARKFSGAKLVHPIMLLEDNFLVAREMKDQLVDFGVTCVEVFSNCAEALEYLDRKEVSLGILDINLGRKETSLPVAEKLKERDTPVVFVSGYNEHIQAPFRPINVPHLIKPVSNEELQHTLALLLD